MRAFDCAARTEAACIAVQRELLAGIDQKDRLDRVDTVAGVDIAYWQASGGEQAVCCIVVIDCASRAVIEKRHAAGPVTFPYIPGCLAHGAGSRPQGRFCHRWGKDAQCCQHAKGPCP